MTGKQGWLTIQQTSRTIIQDGDKVSVDTTAAYTIPQPEDTLAGFKLNAPIHPVDAHIERMSRDVSQQWFRDTFFEAEADA